MNRIACCFFHETSEKSFRTHGNQRESTDPVKQAPHGDDSILHQCATACATILVAVTAVWAV